MDIPTWQSSLAVRTGRPSRAVARDACYPWLLFAVSGESTILDRKSERRTRAECWREHTLTRPRT